MKVPKEIRALERPDHTVVEPYQSGRYAVRTRIDRFDTSGNLLYRRNQVIGYITDAYRPAGTEKPLKSVGRVDSKQFGAVNLLNGLCSDILDDLLGFYGYKDAEWIYCAALLRAMYPGVPDCRLHSRYRHSFVSEIHPGVAMTGDSVTMMLTLLGEQFRTSEKFMAARLGKMTEEELVVIDGCLKQDGGEGLTISRASRKTSSTRTFHHLMMYAYSPELGEPLCSKVYPGNVTDVVAVVDFVSRLEIRNGIMTADRGFRPETMREVAAEHEGLHYLVPLDRGRLVIGRSGCFTFDEVIMRDDGPVGCRKARAKDEDGRELGYWLYSFKDPRIAAEMEADYLEAHAKDLDPDLLEAERTWFGLLVLESDLDMDPGFAYDCYDDRWDIEPLFKLHKSGIGLDDTREKSDETALGSEFVNFLATLMSARLRNHLAQFDSCKYRSFTDVLSQLRDCVKVTEDDGTWGYRTTAGTDMRFYVAVGAVTEPEMVGRFGPKKAAAQEGPRGRGRPRGSKDRQPRKRRTPAELAAAKLKST